MKVTRDCNVNPRIGPERTWNWSQKKYSSERRVFGPHCGIWHCMKCLVYQSQMYTGQTSSLHTVCMCNVSLPKKC